MKKWAIHLYTFILPIQSTLITISSMCFSIKTSTFCPFSAFKCFVCFLQETAIIRPKRIKKYVRVMCKCLFLLRTKRKPKY
jgi:hypothetical protein